MSIPFSNLHVRVVSEPIQKTSRKNSIYESVILEVVASRKNEHWYANVYPNTKHPEHSLFAHAYCLISATPGQEFLIDGKVRKYLHGENINVVIDVDQARPISTDSAALN
jgi:uncharacterized protein (DUF1810 family)